ncbi:MAG: redoxin family protein, partial [Gemmataceae bacterium]
MTSLATACVLLCLAQGAASEPPPPALPSVPVPGPVALVQVGGPGGTLSLSDLAGPRGVVVVFLSFDCPMARGYLPKLGRLSARFKALGITLVGVLPAETLPPGRVKQEMAFRQLEKRTNEMAVTIPLGLDSAGELQKALDARMTPEAFLIDAKGRTVYRGRIDDAYSARLEHRGRVDREDLVLAVESLAAGKPVELPSTRAYGCALARPMPAKTVSPGVPSYHADVAPVLKARCAGCHSPDALAPFALANYEDALRWAEDIRDFTKARRMPPWLPVTSVPLRDCRQMPDSEIQTLARWVEGGCPEGEKPSNKTSPKAVENEEKWALGPPDLILDAGADVEVAPEGKDLFRCLVLPTGLKEGRFVTAYEVKPGNQAVVHHMVHFLDNKGRARKLQEKFTEPQGSSDKGPGYNFSTGPGFFPPTGDLGGWAPGSTPHKLSPGVGYWLPAGTDVVMQVHYHRTGKPEKDRSRLGLYFAKPDEEITHPFQVIPVGALFLTIPADNPSYSVAGKVFLCEDCTLHMLMPHMHLLGKSIRLTAQKPGQPEQLLLDIPRWDYNWQEHYFLQQPMRLPKGTRLSVEAVFDN